MGTASGSPVKAGDWLIAIDTNGDNKADDWHLIEQKVANPLPMFAGHTVGEVLAITDVAAGKADWSPVKLIADYVAGDTYGTGSIAVHNQFFWRALQVTKDEPSDTSPQWERIELLKGTPDGVGIGRIDVFTTLTIPKTHLLCDGSTFDKLVYPDLFKFLGSDKTPDLRDKFVRGWSAARAPMNVQGQATAKPTTPFTADSAGNHQHASAGNHQHTASATQPYGSDEYGQRRTHGRRWSRRARMAGRGPAHHSRRLVTTSTPQRVRTPTPSPVATPRPGPRTPPWSTPIQALPCHRADRDQACASGQGLGRRRLAEGLGGLPQRRAVGRTVRPAHGVGRTCCSWLGEPGRDDDDPGLGQCGLAQGRSGGLERHDVARVEGSFLSAPRLLPSPTGFRSRAA